MTYERAVEILSRRLNCAEKFEHFYVDSIEVEVVKLAIEALKKQVPMIGKNTRSYIRHCPKCGEFVGKSFIYCDECGQRIDWSDKE